MLLPCASGPAPDLAPCVELLDVLRVRLRKLDECIDSVVRSREVLSDYIDATERLVARDAPTYDAAWECAPA